MSQTILRKHFWVFKRKTTFQEWTPQQSGKVHKGFKWERNKKKKIKIINFPLIGSIKAGQHLKIVFHLSISALNFCSFLFLFLVISEFEFHHTSEKIH